MADYDYNQDGQQEAAEGQEGTQEVPLEEGFVEERSTASRNAGMLLAGFALLGAGVIYFMRLKTGPEKANAAVTKEVATADKTIKAFLDDKESMKKMNDLLHNTKKFVDVFKTHETKPQVKVDDLMSNPFQYAPPKPDLTAEQLAELERQKAEEARKLAERKFLDSIANVKVGFILTGKKPSCMINQKMYTEGQELFDGITIQKISPGGITVARGEYKAEISVKK